MLIKEIIKKRVLKKQHPTNKIWLIAEQVSKLTKTTPNRWLREVKNNQPAVERAIIDFKEAVNIKNRIGLFIFLLKKYKKSF